MSGGSGFREELASLAQPADRALRVQREESARAAAWPVAAALLVVVPALYLGLCLVLGSKGIAFSLPLWMVGCMSLLPPAIYLVYAGMVEHTEIAEATKLALLDDELHLQDRLTTAREFLDSDAPTPFMAAAIADAEAHAERARHFAADEGLQRPRLRPVHAVFPALAALCLVLSLFVEVVPSRDAVAANPSPGRADDLRVGDPAPTPDRTKTERPENKPSAQPETARDPRADEQKRGDASTLSKNKKKSRGDQGKGKSSQAESSSGQSSGEGQATDQAQPTKAGKKKKPKPKKDKPAKDILRKKNPKLPQNEEQSVASSGQGKGKGSSRSPTASEWSSKDQSVAEDDEELEEEDDVEDEDEESEARGGLQPSLRQRKPPVNRDLNIGFGGGKPPPHANGRGGPGLPKKQRGVAQLVLGIPYPDQITGTPNPGRTKVTQERIEPQPQNAQPVAAEARPPRTLPLGHLSKPVLLPWMQDLVRNFQMSLREPTTEEPGRGKRVR